jgi:hypothetical protein
MTFRHLFFCWTGFIVLFLIIPVDAAQRQCVLVEGFTNAGCGPCATYNPGIRAVLTAMTRDTCIKISYHVSWPGTDPFYSWNTFEANARVNYYGVGSVPDLFVDYVLQPEPSVPTTLRANIRTRYMVSSPCTISISATPAASNTFHYIASVTAEQDMSGSNYRLYVMLVNDLITYTTPPGTNGETQFPEPFRDTSPNANPGQPFAIGAGQVYSLDGYLNRDASWDLSNCTAIAFVQNSTNREILQTTWAHVTSGATISLTAPNGGELWYAGEPHNITWTSTNLTDNIKLEVMRNYPSGTWQTIAASTPNTGSYTWAVDSPGATAARVRVSGAVQTVIADTSDANFNIGGVQVNSPNGGESWIAGDANSITWTALNMTESVGIELNRSFPGGAWEVITSGTPNTGSYAWTTTTPVSTNARVRVFGTSHSAASDTSNLNFTITSRAVTLLTPNGGETFTAGQTNSITWTSRLVTGSMNIEVNRNYPTGSWETVATNASNSGIFSWYLSSPGSSNARVRITSVTYPGVTDESDGSFTIFVPNRPPVLYHDALHDISPGAGIVTAIARDPSYLLSVVSVKMFYRHRGSSFFDSLSLASTGNPDEYSASLAGLNEGNYEYYLRATDDASVAVYVPADAPLTLNSFSDYHMCGLAHGYDDGSAESYNWVQGGEGSGFLWAVKFGPLNVPFALCGAQIGMSRTLPDSTHTPISIAVYLADGAQGLPGTRIYSRTAGSAGNVVGGLPAGANWAQVSFKDSIGTAPVLTTREFYVAVGNFRQDKYEAFGRDTNGPNAHRSYFYDFCASSWYSEDDTLLSTNAHPGNRMIRVITTDFALTAIRNGNDIVLRWADLGAPLYYVYSATTAGGPYSTLEGISTTNSYTFVDGVNGPTMRFYQVFSGTN